MEILSKRHEVEEVRYERQFQYKADQYFNGKQFNSGYGFPVDKNGRLLSTEKPAQNNFNRLPHDPEYIDFGVQELHRKYMEPAVGKCSCGGKVVLDGSYMGVSQCGCCGKWYDMNGHEMNPPEQWEEPIDYDY